MFVRGKGGGGGRGKVGKWEGGRGREGKVGVEERLPVPVKKEPGGRESEKERFKSPLFSLLLLSWEGAAW